MMYLHRFCDAVKPDFVEMVYTFTKESHGSIPATPIPMSREGIELHTQYVMEELAELAATRMTRDESKQMFGRVIGRMKIPNRMDGTNTTKVIEEQADAHVDAIYYILNSATKYGLDLDPVFREVHRSNMSKRDPETGKFIKDANGKVVKPETWTPPSLHRIILKMQTYGFNRFN